MMLSLFDQFASPKIMGLPLILIATLFPIMIFFTSNRLIYNRLSTTQAWLTMTITKQLLLPINTNGHKWATPLISVMMLLISINLLGLLPYTFTPTTQLSMNMALATPLWLATVLMGLKNQPSTSLGHLLPEGTPPPLIPALIIIETISLFIRPIALGVRLTANLTAGHLLMHLISTAAFNMALTMPTVSLFTLVLLLLLTGLEIAVAMIQAYVFTLLLSLYLQENV
uniref:ATP synthase subunit a n=1 Tax=Lepidophyma flavimaculatum TaxID=264485 RepID=A1IGH4_9SAUR|nr:ATP synthase F0 subunit 6 [Lepidophyma flavimaculatum]BAF43984.1 ATPase subunit 6 [Lepidophyma flavimaculatum]